MASTYSTTVSFSTTSTSTATIKALYYTKYLINDPKMIKWISKLNTHWDGTFDGDFVVYLQQEKTRRDYYNNITDFCIKPRSRRASNVR